MSKLNGKVAIVLGASSRDNMGQVICRRFLDEGAEVVAAGRTEAPLKALADETGCGYKICDITKKADIDELVEFAFNTYGGVHIGVNCTGWGLLVPFEKNTEEDLNKMMALQFRGPFQFFQALVRAMTGGGSIIQISSATATIMLDNHAAYMGTKAGIDHVIRCIANQYGKRGIKANSISPGLTATPMTADAMAMPGLEEAFVNEYPLGRIGTSEDIAEAAVWLASDASFITGQNLQINGGLTLRRNPRQHEITASLSAAAGKSDS